MLLLTIDLGIGSVDLGLTLSLISFENETLIEAFHWSSIISSRCPSVVSLISYTSSRDR